MKHRTLTPKRAGAKHGASWSSPTGGGGPTSPTMLLPQRGLFLVKRGIPTASPRDDDDTITFDCDDDRDPLCGIEMRGRYLLGRFQTRR